MRKLIIANWKMNPRTKKQAVRLAKRIVTAIPKSGKVEIVIAPPFVFLESVTKVLQPKTYNLKPALGAQDVFWESLPAGGGAYTGEVSSSQLKSLGVKYVITGHSERRALGETDEIVNKKVKATFGAGLKVILCVGEPLSVRKRGITAAKRFVRNQLLRNLRGTKTYNLEPKTLVIAYEPIWAISSVGGGKSDTPEDAVVMVKFIRSFLNSKFPGRAGKIHNSKILYGGSVNAKNASRFLNKTEINGALVGRASLRAGEFIKIVRAAQIRS